MTTRQRYTELQNKREGFFFDKNDLTDIYRHNRSTNIVFSIFFFIFEGTLRP